MRSFFGRKPARIGDMGHASINGKSVAPQRSTQVISRSAILILSGVLIGTSIHQGPFDGLSFYGLSAGITGMLSYLGLELVAQRGRQRVVRKTLAAIDSTLTQRLRRHVECQTPKAHTRGRLLPLVLAPGESSYLPVTPAWR
jgi:hypothetical protein